ncbi:hypothetical protein Gpo141_00000901 [Globisporangium polare]
MQSLSMLWVAVTVAQLLLLSHVCSGAFRVIAPVLQAELVSGGANAGMEHRLALFGRIDVGDERDLVAPLVLAPASTSRACSSFNRTEMHQVLVENGILTNRSSFASDVESVAGVDVSAPSEYGDGAQAFVLMIERGDCHFVEKVRHAQEVSAVGVVIYNADKEEDEAGKLPVMADDGTGGDIRIPSLLIYHRDALKLMGMLHASTSSKPSATKVVVLLSWQVVNPDNEVDVALWFSSRSSPAMHAFIETFAKIARAFEDNGEEKNEKDKVTAQVQFTPYYDVYEGSTWGCLASTTQVEANHTTDTAGGPDSSSCDKLCVHDDKFCTYDPERDEAIGLDGRDVLEEDVRQLCILQYAQQQQNNKTTLFWEYVSAFNSKCSPLSATASEFNDECSQRVLASLNIPSAEIAACVRDQGASLLAAQMSAKRKFGVLAVPQLTVNNAPFHGLLACSDPISLATCAPLQQVCVAFKGTTSVPQACTEAFWRDSCFAPLERDNCGDCNLRGGDHWNRKCSGCDGVPHSMKDLDECGVCGGNGSFDVCGRCLPQEDTSRDTSCLDCKGVPNGSARRDACGICDGHGSFDACGLCLDAHDLRRQNVHCRVIEDPDAVKGKAQITGIRASQFRGKLLESFQVAIGAAANVSARDVLLKSVDDVRDGGGEGTSTSHGNVEVFFFIPCGDDACRLSTVRLLQGPSASLTVAMKMRAHLDAVAYGLDEAANIEHVHLHSVSTLSGAENSDSILATQDAVESVMVASSGVSSSSKPVSWGVVLGALCLLTLLAGFVALKARDDRIRRDFQQMFAAYTPLTSLDQDEDRNGSPFA